MNRTGGWKKMLQSLGFCLKFSGIMALLAAMAWADALPSSGPVTGPQAQALIGQLGEKLLVVDVRTPEEFAKGHIPNALLLPVSELEARLDEMPADRPILLICRTGRRATRAFNVIVKARPKTALSGIWRLEATTEYKPDGSYLFQNN